MMMRPARNSGSSPHTRGAPPGRLSPARIPRIIPAYAGSTGTGRTLFCGGTDHPRIRGEHIAAAILSEARAGSSPHTRGAHRQDRGSRAVPGIIPAYAGSTSDSAFV